LAGYHICGNLPTIQILIKVRYTLRQFYQKVKRQSAQDAEISEIFDGVDVDPFHSHCPLCGGFDCARFLGYYYRQVIDEKGRYYPDFPVPRFVCQRKGKHAKVNHKTFSLLHYHLIPYSVYSLPFVIKALQSRYIDGMTVESIQKYHGNIISSEDNYKEVSASGIFAFKSLLVKAITKILVSGYYPRLSNELAGTSQETVRLKIFLAFCRDFICQKYIPPIRGPCRPCRPCGPCGPCALSYDFYITGGSYLRNAFFLFGTPSQFRRINDKQQTPIPNFGQFGTVQ
jgi:hypothetical protein